MGDYRTIDTSNRRINTEMSSYKKRAIERYEGVWHWGTIDVIKDEAFEL